MLLLICGIICGLFVTILFNLLSFLEIKRAQKELTSSLFNELITQDEVLVTQIHIISKELNKISKNNRKILSLIRYIHKKAKKEHTEIIKKYLKQNPIQRIV